MFLEPTLGERQPNFAVAGGDNPERGQGVLRASPVQHHREAQQDAQSNKAGRPVEFFDRELPPVAAHQHRQVVLLGTREAGQVHVLEQVAAVLVVLAVGDVHADLVQESAPAKQPGGGGARQAAGRARIVAAYSRCVRGSPGKVLGEVPGDLLEDLRHGGGHTPGVAGVDVVAPHEIGDRRFANVVGVNASQEVVQQAFPQGAVGHGHTVDPERIDDGGRDGQPPGQHRCPLGVD